MGEDGFLLVGKILQDVALTAASHVMEQTLLFFMNQKSRWKGVHASLPVFVLFIQLHQ